MIEEPAFQGLNRRRRNRPLAACGGGGSDENDTAANTAAAEQAHVAYRAAFNSNDIDKFQPTITDDMVYMAPYSPEIVGRAAINAWVKDYFAAYQTAWVKESLEFVVENDLACERYRYKSVDTPRADGPAAGSRHAGGDRDRYRHQHLSARRGRNLARRTRCDVVWHGPRQIVVGACAPQQPNWRPTPT